MGGKRRQTTKLFEKEKKKAFHQFADVGERGKKGVIFLMEAWAISRRKLVAGIHVGPALGERKQKVLPRSLLFPKKVVAINLQIYNKALRRGGHD